MSVLLAAHVTGFRELLVRVFIAVVMMILRVAEMMRNRTVHVHFFFTGHVSKAAQGRGLRQLKLGVQGSSG